MKRVVLALALSGAFLLATWAQAPASPAGSLPRLTDDQLNELAHSAQNAAPAAQEVQQAAERLRQRLSAEIPAPAPTRNPFTFRTNPPPAKPAGRAATMPAAVAVPVAPAPPVPVMPTLVGITEEGAAGALVRTAVLSIGDDLAMVKVGQTFTHFEVRAIGATTVDLVDIASASRTISTLVLR